MTTLQFVLSTLIRNGKVTVETPDIDMEELRRAVDTRARRTLAEVCGVVFAEELTDGEKVAWLRERLAEE